MVQANKRVLSGVQPSGALTLGNYLGAIKPWLQMQDNYECWFCLVDLHALTSPQNPVELRRNTLDLLAWYLACGLDPKRCKLFLQSHVPAHAELAWILSTIAHVGEFNRMTQFKDKSAKQDKIGLGLFTYPALMAADILLYHANLVPVGEDQKQHLEMTRDLAFRFNHRFGDILTVPDPLIGQVAARVMGLQHPERKMSKSDGESANVVLLGEDLKSIEKKFKRAVTDSGSQVVVADDKPGVSNLIHIYAALADISPAEVERKFAGEQYGRFKQDLAQLAVNTLGPIQERYQELRADEGALMDILRAGAADAATLANKTLADVYHAVGLLRL